MKRAGRVHFPTVAVPFAWLLARRRAPRASCLGTLLRRWDAAPGLGAMAGGAGAPAAARDHSTFMPSRMRSTPSVTTRSPAFSPESIAVSSPSAGPGLHRAHRDGVVVLHHVDDGALRGGALHRGRGHRHRVRAACPRPCARSRTGWGRAGPGDWGTARAAAPVPVETSIWLSVVASAALARAASSARDPRPPRAACRRSCRRCMHARQGVLRDGEEDRDRVELRDDRDAVGVGAAHLVAGWSTTASP